MNGRNRSRSPHGSTSTEEIVQIVIQREQARLSKDFASADQLRDRLSAIGVSLWDKNAEWRADDGRTGRIPTFSEIDEGRVPDFSAGMNFGMSQPVGGMDAMGFGAAAETGEGEGRIRQLVQMREQARAKKDFAESDRVRDELKSMGVELYDKEKLWKQAATGMQGCIMGYHKEGPTDTEISKLVIQRETARQNKDFAKADMIRDELKRAGVNILDKEKMWKTNSGRQGPVPSYEQIASGATGMPGPGDMGGGGGGGGFGGVGGNKLQAQIMEAAMAAQHNPHAAQKALQMLAQIAAQGGGGGGGGGGGCGGGGGGCGKGGGKGGGGGCGGGGGGGGAVSDDAQQALSFIQKCNRTPGDAEISWLVETREKVRFKKDFAGSDQLRDAMKSMFSLEIFDKDKRWQISDGRSGIVPSFEMLGL